MNHLLALSKPDYANTTEHIQLLLRLCLRSRWDETSRGAARSLLEYSNYPWPELTHAALETGVAARLWAALDGWAEPPPEVQQRLWRVSRYITGRNAYLLAELQRVLSHLAHVGIPSIVLKGAALVDWVYDIRCRPMDDLDLLVRPEDLPAAAQVLHELGYVKFPEMRSGFAQRFAGELAFRKPGLIRVALDLHWSLINSAYFRYRVSLDWFWKTARPASFGQAPACILAPEAQVLHLCAHLWRHHRGAGLAGWCDLAEVLQAFQGSLDWDELLDQAQHSRLLLPLQRSLPILARDWRVAVPEGVLHRLAALVPAADEVVHWQQHLRSRQGVPRWLWARLSELPSWRLRLLFLRDFLFPSRSYMQWRFPNASSPLLPACYPYRWFLGLRRFPHSQHAPGPHADFAALTTKF